MRGIAEFLVHGRVGTDPELTLLTNGTPRCRVSVCANIPRKINDKWDSIPVWFNVAWFGQAAETIHERIEKGTVVVIRGDITTYKTDVEGVNITNYNFTPRTTSIVGKTAAHQHRENGTQQTDASSIAPASQPPAAPPASQPPASASSTGSMAGVNSTTQNDPFTDDDIPF